MEKGHLKRFKCRLFMELPGGGVVPRLATNFIAENQGEADKMFVEIILADPLTAKFYTKGATALCEEVDG